MIAKLTGLLYTVGEDRAIVDVAGVGYLVYCSARTLANLPGAGDPVALLIETHVREDHIHLYGFSDSGERDWFRLLSTVQGVGARMALAILSALPPAELVRAIATQDKATLTRASGVGPKLATRIVAELKDKAGQIFLGPVVALPGGRAADAEAQIPIPYDDAISALVNLGYQARRGLWRGRRSDARAGRGCTARGGHQGRP